MRSFLALTAVVLVAIGVGIGALAVSRTDRVHATVQLSAINLPEGYQFVYLQRSGSNLELLGSGPQTNQCATALVSTASLHLVRVSSSSCDDTFGDIPAGQSVTAVVSSPYSNRATVRIAHRANGKVTYGPVVMTFSDASDTHLEQTYGDGSLWVFDTETPTGAVLLRVAPSGQVKNRIELPGDPDRPMLATNDDGLWMAVAVNGGDQLDRGGSPIYHVEPGSNTATIVHQSGYGAFWITASGHQVWVDVPSFVRSPANGTIVQTLWSFHGASARPTSHRNITPLSIEAVTDDQAGDLLALVAPGQSSRYGCSGPQKVERFDPSTGQETTVARLPSETITAPYGCQLLGSGKESAFVNGKLYLLYQATPDSGYGGFMKLYQVAS